jgi:CheY-like chemotaxis protein
MKPSPSGVLSVAAANGEGLWPSGARRAPSGEIGACNGAAKLAGAAAKAGRCITPFGFREERGKMMRAIIIDDEPLAREELEAILHETGYFEVVGRCGDALTAIHAIRRERPDVLFLDVQMPGMTGLELLGMIDDAERPRFVVFVTAHEGFAVEAF